MFDQDRNRRLMDLFAEGVELDVSQRAEFVERECSDDSILRQELAELLEMQRNRLGGFMATPAVARPSELQTGFPEVDRHIVRELPQIVGYSDMVLIGEGGMGAVYRAQQLEPVRRTVAIKVIRAGQDSRVVLQRFEAERQALSRMAHPFIATVHDAGTDSSGRPFLVMEYVEGSPINVFCEAHKLALHERLELFAKVCEAVDHAHRRGVLHRDLKPSNVLVNSAGETPMPKVIDFGIAKATEGGLTDLTLLTEQGAFLGTPEYMSPEQLDTDSRTVDIRTDVYALGVMLYELLTGELPFPSKRLRAAGLTGMATILRNEIPAKPSTRLRRAAEPKHDAATQRTSWPSRLKGDLDWVVMKALEKDPEQRYAAPRDLAEDLRRHLQNLPVHAGPPSGLYRLRRFARRYRLQVAAGLLILLSLIVGLSGTLWFLFESQEREQLAERRTQEAFASARLAVGSRIAAEAALVTADDPNLALLLAIEASNYLGSFGVANAVYDALPTHDLLAEASLRDHDTKHVQFLPDGRLLVQTDGNVLWLLAPDGLAVLRRYEGHEDRIQNMSVATELGLVATASDDATVRVWQIEAGTCEHVLQHEATVLSVAFSLDRRWLATQQENGWVRVYDASSLALRYEFKNGASQWSSFAFHPRESWILLSALDRTLEIYDLTDGQLQQRVSKQNGPLAKNSRVSFGPAGDRILRVLYEETAVKSQLLSLSGDVLNEFGNYQPLPGATTDPQVLGHAGHVVWLSMQTGEVVGEVQLEQRCILLGCSPDGDAFVAVNAQEDVCLFDASSGKRVRDLAGRSDKRWSELDVGFHPDGRRFAVTGRDIRIWTLDPEFAPWKPRMDRSPPRFEGVRSIACNESEALALLQAGPIEERSWELWSIDGRRKLHAIPPHGLANLKLCVCGTKLIGSVGLPAVDGQPIRTRCVVLDLEGNLLHERVIAADPANVVLHPDGTAIFVTSAPNEDQRQFDQFDIATGERGVGLAIGRAALHLHPAQGRPHASASYGSADRTDIFDLQTGSMVRSIRGPAGASQYAEAVDPVAGRLLIVFGNQRARAFDLHGTSDLPTGEYTRLVRSNRYAAGFIPHSDLAWVMCANEVHVFHAVTCRPFAVLRLDHRVEHVAVRPDGSELLTSTNSGKCQKWPLDPVAIAKRMAVGSLDSSTLELFDIGTEAEREARERQRLQARLSPRGWAVMAERLQEVGKLDEAIECYQRVCALGPLAKSDRLFYVRLLELLGRRLAVDTSAAAQERDGKAVREVLEHCLRCEVPRAQLLALPVIDALRRHPDLRQLLDR